MTNEAGENEPEATRGLRAARVLWAMVKITVRALGWIFLPVALGVQVFEHTGLLDEQLEQVAKRMLAEDALPFSIGEIEVRWLSREVRIDRLQYGEQGRELRLDDVRIVFDWGTRRGFRVERVVVRGGHVRLSENLTRMMRARETEQPQREFDMTRMPTIAAENVAVTLAKSGWDDLPLGRIDIHGRVGQDAELRLDGRIVPPATDATPSPGVVLVSGALDEAGMVRVQASASALPISHAYLPRVPAFEAVRDYDPRGSLNLQLAVDYEVGATVPSAVEATLAIDQGSVQLPYLEDRSRRVEEVSVALHASYDSAAGEELWTREAWNVVTRADARWESIPLELWVRGGTAADEGVLVEADIHSPNLAIGTELQEVTAPSEWLQRVIFPMLQPAGAASLFAGARIRSDWTPAGSLADALDVAFVVAPEGRASAAYHGFANQQDGEFNLGYPLRVDDISGHIFFCYNREVERSAQFALHNVGGDHGSGDVRVNGILVAGSATPENQAKKEHFDFYLSIASDSLAVSESVGAAFQGLSGVITRDEVWDRYDPTAGELGFLLQFCRRRVGDDSAERNGRQRHGRDRDRRADARRRWRALGGRD